MNQEDAEQIKAFVDKFVEVPPPEFEMPRVSFTTIFSLDGYELNYPINICIEYEHNSVVALWPDVETWADGRDVFEAVESLKNNIATLADDILEAPSETLGEQVKGWQRSLRVAIKREVEPATKAVVVPYIPISVEDEAIVDEFMRESEVKSSAVTQEAANRPHARRGKLNWSVSDTNVGPILDPIERDLTRSELEEIAAFLSGRFDL